MRVCVITHSVDVGRRKVAGVFWDVAADEVVARALVMERYYNAAADASVLDEDEVGWSFEMRDVVEGSTGPGSVHRWGA